MTTINSIFYEHVLSAAGSTKVSFPNVQFDKTVINEYYSVICLPQKTLGVGISELDRQNGFCQVSCYVRSNVGEINAIDMANVIIDAFPRNSILVSGTTKIRIDKPPYYSGGLQTEDGWYMIPVTIPFTVLK